MLVAAGVVVVAVVAARARQYWCGVAWSGVELCSKSDGKCGTRKLTMDKVSLLSRCTKIDKRLRFFFISIGLCLPFCSELWRSKGGSNHSKHHHVSEHLQVGWCCGGGGFGFFF